MSTHHQPSPPSVRPNVNTRASERVGPLSVTCFATYVTDEARRSREHQDARNFLLALRGRRFPGESRVPVRREPRSLRYANADDSIDWFGEMAAEYLESQGLPRYCALVPVPTANTTVGSPAPWTSLLALATIANGFERGELLDALRWKKPILVDDEQPYSVAELYENLALVQPITPGRRIVLVDYLFACQKTLRAIAARLGRAGASVSLALCAGRTATQSSLEPFRVVTAELADFEPGH